MRIGTSSFENCKTLSYIDIPQGVGLIDPNAFSGCSSLMDIVIPENVLKIGEKAFSGCTSLKKLSIPKSVDYNNIGKQFVDNCTCELSIYPKKLKTEDDNVITNYFYGTILVPDDASNIPEGVFTNNKGLKGYKGKFASKDGRCLIYNGTLIAYCKNSIEQAYLLPNGIKKIGKYACRGFSMYPKISAFRLSEGVEEIGEYAFINHFNDFSVLELPSTLKQINKNAFSYCWHLKYINCQAVTPPITDESLGGFNNELFDLKAIYVPTESVELYKNAIGWMNFSDKIKGYDWNSTDATPIYSSDLWPYLKGE